jgi:hypothetical protein
MYERKFVEKYKMERHQWFKEGSNDKEMEIGPSIMVNKRRAMYPGIYSLPDCT